jgi:hypothetical protein
MKRMLLLMTALALLLGGVGQARAGFFTYTVTLDTSALTNNPGQGPFLVVFDLEPRNQSVINNNTATISNFNLHGGSLTSGTTSSVGSVSGDLSSQLMLSTNTHVIDNSFLQDFTPGSSTPSSLSFTLGVTTNGTIADRFLFRIGYGPQQVNPVSVVSGNPP